MQTRRPNLPEIAALTALLLVTACGDDPAAKRPTSSAQVESDCSDGADNDGDGVTDCDDLDCRAAATSCELAPKLDRTVPTTVWESAQFLFTGKDAVQKETSAKAFSKKRIAILRGRVVDRTGEPLAGVRVNIAAHDKWGYTVSRPDGVFDLAVEGGSQLLVQFSREGFLSAERGVQVAWRSYESVPEVGLIESGKAVTKLAANADREQVAEGDVVEDALGRRQPVVVFVSETTATAKLPDGSEEELKNLHVRLAEYPFETPSVDTIDEPARFAPGTAPHPGSLNWGIEATIDEAQALGATTVEFSTPASILVENFLGLPVGSPIPLGYYERGKGQWQGEAPGRVIEVLSITEGEADVDADGDGEADDTDTLQDLNIWHGTRRELARRYEPGAKIWHIPVSHFSPHSADFATAPRKGAEVPSAGAATVRPIDQPTRHGSLLVERQALGQAFSLGLAGTPFSLRYQSDRTAEYRKGFQIKFPAVGDKVPEGLKRVSVRVNIAGQTLRQNFKPEANKQAIIDWDGKDAFGRVVQGQQRARVALSYIYDGELRPSESFGATSRVSVTSSASDDGVVSVEAALTKRFSITTGTFDASGYQLGGLGLDVLHAYDPGTGKIYFGSGDERSAENVALVTTRPAGDATLGTPDGVFAAADGSIIVSQDDELRGDLGRLLQITAQGEVFALAGEGAQGDAAALVLGSPQGVTMKSDGSILVADFLLEAIREISPDGSFRTLVGASDDVYGDAEVEASLRDLDGIALGLREELYIINGDEVLKLEGGALTRFAGTGEAPETGDVLETEGAPATTVALNVPSGVAVGPDGSVFISERDGARVRVVTPDGFIRTVAGTGVPGFSGDGQRATAAQLSDPRGLALSKDGSLYIADQLNNRIRRVTPDGFIQTVVGGGEKELRDGQLPTQITLDKPDGISFGNDGALYVATGSTVYKVAPGLTEIQETNDSLIPSEDGHTLYRFNARGKHLQTINAVTGLAELVFGYDEDTGLLATITDKNGLVTKVQRDGDGVPGTIVGPFGQRTNLDIFEGELKSITDPLDRTVTLEYDDGLLSKVVSPEGAERSFEYSKDGLGRLEKLTEPSGYSEDFEPKVEAADLGLTVITPSGAKFDYETIPDAASVIRAVTGTDGTRSVLKDQGTSAQLVLPDGTRIVANSRPDQGFGAQVLLPADATITTPSGRVLDTTFQEAKTFAEASNFLSARRWERVTLVNGLSSSTVFNRDTQSISYTSPTGRTRLVTLDKRGQPVSVEATGFGTTRFAHDAFGRVTTVTRATGNQQRTQAYGFDDSDGFLRSATDPIDQTTSYAPDLVGRLLGVTDPSGASIEQRFDADDRLKLITLPGKAEHAFEYKDRFGLLELVTPPAVEGQGREGLAVGAVKYEYNDDNQPVLRRRSDGNDIAYKYDSARRLTEIRTSGIAVTYGYDGVGKLSTLSRSDGPSVALGYDGPLLTSTEWSGPIEGKLTADYNENFQLSQLTVNDTSTVSFTYDPDGLLESASGNGQTLTIKHDAQTGFATSTALGSVATSYATNGFGELTRIEVTTKAAPTLAQDIERDALGRITRITETLNGRAQELAYTYDAAGRLETVTRDGVVTTYQYDPRGNRLGVVRNGTTTDEAEFDAQDRIRSHGSFSFEQTQHGDLVRRSSADSSLELSYDGLGTLLNAQVSKSGKSTIIDYTMDGQGRRVGKRVGGKFVGAWLYQDALRPISEIGPAGVFSHFVYAGDGAPAFMLRAGVPFRFVKDHLGSVRLVINTATGAIAQRLEYDEFGRVLQDTAPGFQPFGFAGGLHDTDTGLVHFGARDYDPEIGRWVNKDPIEFEGGPNFYAYCGSDPVNNVDPTGRVIQAQVGEDSRLMGRASEFLFGNAGKEWGRGNYGTAVLDGAAGMATLISSVLAMPGMEFVGGPMSVVTKAEVAAVKGAFAVEAKLAGGAFSPIVEGGGLVAHEGAGLGHTISKHIGQSQAALSARLVAEPNIAGASTFVARTEAEAALSSVMTQRSSEIASWVAAGANGTKPFSGVFSGGVVLARGAVAPTVGTGARVVLRGTGGGGYFILTGFPL